MHGHIVEATTNEPVHRSGPKGSFRKNRMIPNKQPSSPSPDVIVDQRRQRVNSPWSLKMKIGGSMAQALRAPTTLAAKA